MSSTRINHIGIAYAVVNLDWQTKSVLGALVCAMAANPPSTSLKLCKPLAFKIEAAIILL